MRDGRTQSFASPEAQLSMLTTGSLHQLSYLLRLLDEHRPADPLTFLLSVLRRGTGGMSLTPPVLLELLLQAPNLPVSSLTETLRFSLTDEVGDTRDALWREVTFTAARAMCSVAGRRVSGSVEGSVTRGAVIDQNSALPSFETLYQRGAPWQMLFAHSIATSRMLIASVAGQQVAGCDKPAVHSALTLHVVVEIDAEDPASHVLCLRRADCAEGGELLELLLEELELLSPVAEGIRCTLDLVLVSRTAAIDNCQSNTQTLFRLLEDQISVYSTARRSASAEHATKLRVVSSVRAVVADGNKWTFAPLHACLEAPGVDVRNPTAYIVWLRDPRRHTEVLTQLGHVLYPFAAHQLSSRGVPFLSMLDPDCGLVVDLRSGEDDAAAHAKSTGVAVKRSFLRWCNAQPTTQWYSHMQRHCLRLSCGEAAGESRLPPASSPLVLVALGGHEAVKCVPQLAQSACPSWLRERAPPCSQLMRLLSMTTALLGGVSDGERVRAAHTCTSPILFCRCTAPPPTAELLTALSEGCTIARMSTERTLEGSFLQPPAAADAGTWGEVFELLTPPKFDEFVRTDPLTVAVRRLMSGTGQNSIEMRMLDTMPKPEVLSRSVYVAVDEVDEDGAPCVGVRGFVQELSAQYMLDFIAGTVKTPRAVAAMAAAAAAVAAASVAAPPSPIETKKPKKSDAKGGT